MRPSRGRPHVVVVGAGFAGLSVVQALRGAHVDVTLIDQRNYHTFQPLLYQVATAALDAGDVAHQVRDVLRHLRHARFRMGRVVGLDLDARTLRVAARPGEEATDELRYDHLVLTPGAVYHDFDVPGVRDHAFVLKGVAEAVTLRSHLLRRFEEASRRVAVQHAPGSAGSADRAGAGSDAPPAPTGERHPGADPGVATGAGEASHPGAASGVALDAGPAAHPRTAAGRAAGPIQQAAAVPAGALDVVIVGAGPTGVEMAGALVELFRRVLPSDFPELDLTTARVVLLEAAPHVLIPYHPTTRTYVERVLRDRGVVVRTGAVVREVTADRVLLADGSEVPYGTLVWAAGVRAHPLAEALGVPLDRAGRVPVHDDLSMPGRPEVWIAGDCAGPVGTGPAFPQVAQVAKQQGRHVARGLRARWAGRPTRPFRYVDLGQMAIVGRSSGVAELSSSLGGFRMRGLLGWLAWLFIHLVHLPGHQNRWRAFIGWAYEWFTYDRHARLILEPFDRALDRAGPPPAPSGGAAPAAPPDAAVVPPEKR
jgi:NADH dehydrogenase FAD-containing subunit